MTSPIFPTFPLFLPSHTHSLSSLLTIGSHLYTMMSSIYRQQFNNIAPLEQPNPPIKTQDLMLDEEVDIDDINLEMSQEIGEEATPGLERTLPKNSSFSTFYTNDSLHGPMTGDIMHRSDSFSMFSSDDIFTTEAFGWPREKSHPEEDSFFQAKKTIKKTKTLQCKFCPHLAPNKQQLGGHVSRNHKGKGVQSERKRIAKRNQDYEKVLKSCFGLKC